MVGTKLSHYAILSRLGAGGMGVVYRAHDDRLHRTVALKTIAHEAVADPELRQRFLREARTASTLNHPNIVTIHEIDEAGGVDFLVMELVDGRPLDEHIGQGLPIGKMLDYAIQLGAALAAAHAAGIVHRDIKPANVMVTSTGHIKVLDFGIAKLLTRAADPMATTVAAAVSRATGTGMMLGTIGYMSPEQARGELVDARADMFSFGAVMYEMLAGRAPFQRDTAIATLTAILGDNPAPLRPARPDLPADVERLVMACLEKDRQRRPSADEAVRTLTTIRSALAAPRTSVGATVRRPAVVAAAAVIVAVLGSAGWWWQAQTARERWARDVVPAEARRLIERGDIDTAYRTVRDALAVLPHDPQLKQLWVNGTLEASFDSEPRGADVAVRGYSATNAAWIPIGSTPLENVRVPFGPIWVQVTKPGFTPVVSTIATFKSTYVLDPPASVPPGMVRVAGGSIEVEGTSRSFADFWIDKFEVTNREFKDFVDQGGYRTPAYWQAPFVEGGRPLSLEQAMAKFLDRTGRPGPSTWELGTYPDGQDDFPVNGVSWYEAAAYAAFRKKALPSAFHWRRAAAFGNGTFNTNFADILTASNFGLKGPAPVGSHLGLGPFGTYDMAGNVKEWCWNEAPGGRMILGGAWNEPSYMFQDRDAQSPLERSATFGFRLALYPTQPATDVLAPIRPVTRNYASESPMGDAEFAIVKGLYRYDAEALDARVESTEEAGTWVKETVSFNAAYGGERVRAYLYLPKAATPPYQTVVYFPGGDAPIIRSSRDLRLLSVDFIIRSGRALLYPVYAGTYERQFVVTGMSTFRDVTINRVKDVLRSVDYLQTRHDVDQKRLGFYGVSLGATMGTIATAIDSRFAATVLQGGGLSTRTLPPEIDPFNLAPRIQGPTLLVGGRFDFSNPVEASQKPLFRLIGTPPDRKRHAIFDGGHLPTNMFDVIKEVLDWFDRYLGPVVTGPPVAAPQ